MAGRIHWAKGEYGLAQSSENSAIDEIERSRRNVVGGELVLESFFEDKLAPYHDMVDLMIGQKNFEGALAYAERSKSRVLLDALQHGRNYAGKFMSPEEQHQELTLRAILISLNRRISGSDRSEVRAEQIDSLRALRASARLDYEIFRANLYVNHPEMLLNQRAQEFGLAALNRIWPDDDTALLEFVLTEDNSYLFVITKRTEASTGTPNVQVYNLRTGTRDLANKVNSFRIRVSHPEGPIEQSANELYNVLIKPAEQQLSDKKKWLIVPDGPLWELPFQALKPLKGRFLLDDRVVSYAPSLATLQEMRSLRNQRPSAGEGVNGNRQYSQEFDKILVVGNPASVDKSKELPATRAFAQKLQTEYGKSRVQMLVGADADEKRVKTEAGRYRIIHIGSHGILDGISPMYSYLVLAQSAEDALPSLHSEEQNPGVMDLGRDGFLESWEVMDLQLGARLVVLSACETARGRLANGEGVMGMSWALFMAGTPATIVSQWNVESESTNELMLAFYQELLTKQQFKMKMDPAEALQRAAITLKGTRGFAHPYYWAGFVFIGDSNK
jgi:CHAT domain-containing protein